MKLGVNHPARKRWREKQNGERKKWDKLEKGWNNTPLRYRPAELVGLKPKTPEPWAIDEAYYQRKTGNFETALPKERYDDRNVINTYTWN